MPKLTIEVTQEELEAHKRGEAITIEPPKQWETEGRYRVFFKMLDKEKCGSLEFMNFSADYPTSEAAQKALNEMRIHNRLLAYVAQYGAGWEANWGRRMQAKHYIRYDPKTKKYRNEYAFCTRDFGIIYMPKECAEGLVAKLNNREVVL